MHKKLIAVIAVLAIITISAGGVIATQKMQPKTESALNTIQPNTVPTINTNAAPTQKVKNPEKQTTYTTKKQSKAKKQFITKKQDTTTKQGITKKQDTTTKQDTTKVQNNPNVNISPEQAKAAAQSVIAEPSMLAGTPKLVYEAGGYTYYVPVISNGKAVGEIFINAQTGKCIVGTA